MVAGTQQVQLPVGARIVRVAEQHGGISVWYLTDTDTVGVIIHHMRIVGTGDRVPDGWVYLGTADVGDFVFHVFEDRIPEHVYPYQGA